nr:immunoglobulin heavy chain junction region [Mus musculus]
CAREGDGYYGWFAYW